MKKFKFHGLLPGPMLLIMNNTASQETSQLNQANHSKYLDNRIFTYFLDVNI